MHCDSWNADRAAAAAQVKDNKGDTLEYPKIIQSLPFWDTANTYFFNDDYTVTCNGQYTDQSGGKVGIHVTAACPGEGFQAVKQKAFAHGSVHICAYLVVTQGWACVSIGLLAAHAACTCLDQRLSNVRHMFSPALALCMKRCFSESSL